MHAPLDRLVHLRRRDDERGHEAHHLRPRRDEEEAVVDARLVDIGGVCMMM